MKIDFTGKVALITGGSRGIGRATAHLFAEHGADVAVNYQRDASAADSVVMELKRYGTRSERFLADIADSRAVDQMVTEVIVKFGRLDVLVNNAGIWKEGPIDSITNAQIDEMIDINLKSLFYCCRAAVPHLKKTKGSIINIASTAGQRGEAFHSHYAATKGATISFTKSLAPELIGDGIRVNCVAPGWVDTDMSKEALASPDAHRYISLIPMGRPGTPFEIAGPIAFLASEWATFITGEVLNVNGGAVLCG
jgi:3-oxoacyl-[acyl-carrier protein] reductase